MKFYRKFIVSFLSIVMLLWWLFCIAQNSALLTLTIQWQGLIIWTPENVPLEITAWETDVFTLSDYLWIEDLRGSKDGHYTSIQWLVYWWDGEIISWATVKFNTNSGSFTLIWGEIEGDESFNTNLTDYTDITEPKILFYRNNNQEHIWYVNRLWFKPSVKVTVPNDAPSWPYSLRLSYTLYDMPVTIE